MLLRLFARHLRTNSSCSLAREIPADGTIRKPFDVDALVGTIRRCGDSARWSRRDEYKHRRRLLPREMSLAASDCSC
jgi:hypothetical protein